MGKPLDVSRHLSRVVVQRVVAAGPRTTEYVVVEDRLRLSGATADDRLAGLDGRSPCRTVHPVQGPALARRAREK
uniref:hypothetical protein n=1 Tax=uncultured Caulobacter sp. TaxID=158749 RepID=UPI0025F267DF|nr:hypothetical protein [uncultured Caulobacter sp.]